MLGFEAFGRLYKRLRLLHDAVLNPEYTLNVKESSPFKTQFFSIAIGLLPLGFQKIFK